MLTTPMKDAMPRTKLLYRTLSTVLLRQTESSVLVRVLTRVPGFAAARQRRHEFAVVVLWLWRLDITIKLAPIDSCLLHLVERSSLEELRRLKIHICS